jgi:hypothetical protein
MAPCWAIMDFLQYGSSFLDVIIEKKFSDCQFGGGKKGVVKEDTWFIGIHLLVKVLSSGKEICDSVGVAGDVGQFVVEILEVFDLLRLSASDLLWLAEVLEILVISAHFNRVRSSKEEGATTFEPKQDSSEFLIVSVIVLFSG